jgi:hypothetical protein
VAVELKSDDEASMRAAFLGHAFALNARLSNLVSLLGSGEILLVTPAMLRRRDRTSKRKSRLEEKEPGAA